MAAKNLKPPQPSFSDKKSNIIPQPPEVKQIEWSFSFKYFRQIELFGLKDLDPKWFVALINRLQDLSSVDIERLKTDKILKSNLRYHPIDWEARNIPIKRTALNWIDKVYLNNEIDYPLIQFHISKALGRVVGFWNEKSSLFYIVLLDPMHNIQPSNYNEYKINPSHPLSCQYSSLIKDIELVKNKTKSCPTCDIITDISKIPSNFHSTNTLVFFLEEEYLAALKLRLKNQSLSDIIELGLSCD